MRPRRHGSAIAAVVAALLAVVGGATPPAFAADTACSSAVFETQHFTVCHAEPAKHDIRLYLKRADGTFYASPEALPQERLLFATNAGMFAPGYEPAGLFVEQGKQIKALNARDGGGNFHLMPNGVFWMKDSKAHVSARADYAALKLSPDLATQSGPMLVIAGALHPKFEPNGPSRTIRNGIGVTATGSVAVAISLEPVSFGVFARLFRDHLQCPNALYLDGSVSQLVSAGARTGPRLPLGPLLAVYARE